MCLTIDKDKNKVVMVPEYQPTIAEKDIIVWKYGKLVGTDLFTSPYYHNTYKKNVLNNYIELKVEKNIYDDRCFVNDGYHAYRSKFICHKNSWANFDIERFIIPKGCAYFIGTDGEIVSSNIMWSPETKLQKLKRKLICQK